MAANKSVVSTLKLDSKKIKTPSVKTKKEEEKQEAERQATTQQTAKAQQALYDSMLEKALGATSQYAKQGAEQTREVANTVQGGMTTLNTGDKASFNWDTARQAQKAKAKAVDYYRALGLFDTQDYATDAANVNLVSSDYLKQMADELLLQKERAEEDDIAHDNYRKALQETATQYPQTAMYWQHMYNNLDAMDEETSPWFWGYADYLLNGDKSAEFDPSVYNDAWDAMTDDEREQDYARLKAQFDSLDWDTLTDKNRYDKELLDAKAYESQVPTYDAYIKTVSDEIARREELDALKEAIRADADYATLSAYVNPGSATTWEEVNSGKDRAYVNGENLKNFFINNPMTREEREQFIEDPGVAVNYGGAIYQAYFNAGYDYLTEDELADYNALYNAGRFDDAARYLELLRPELLQRRAGVNEQYYRTKAVSDVPSAIGSAVQSVAQGVGNIAMLPLQVYETAKGIDNPYSAAFDLSNAQGWTRNEQQSWIANQEDVANWLKDVEGFLYSGATGAADNFARTLAAGFNPALSLVFAGVQGASGALYDTAGNDEIEIGAKILKALTSGAYEVGTEFLRLDELFDMGKDSAVKYILSNMAAELGEETVNTLAEDVTEAVLAHLFNYESEIRSGADVWDDLLDTWYQTAGSTLFSSTGGATVMTTQNKNQVNKVNQNGDMNQVISIGKALGSDTESGKLAQKLQAKLDNGKKLRINEQGALIRAITEDVGAQNAQAVQDVLTESVTERLVELGESQEEAEKTAPAISKMYLGEKLSLQDRAMVNWSDNADQVMKELHETIQEGDENRTGKGWVMKSRENVMAQALRNAETTDRLEKALGVQRKQQTETQAQEGQQGETQKAEPKEAEVARTAAAVESARQKQEIVKDLNLNEKQVAYEGDGEETETGEFQRVEKNGGELVAVVKNGEGKEVSVSLEKVSGTGDEGTTAILEYAKDAGRNMSTAQINTMVKAYETEGGDVGAFIDSFENAYLAGYTGLEETRQREGITAIAYEQGKAEAQADEQTRLERIRNAKRTSTGKVTWIGQVKSFSEITGKGSETSLTEAVQTLTENQKDVVRLVEKFAQKFGVDVVLYESDRNSAETLPNGQYSSETNTVYLDVLGGANTAEDVANLRKNGTLGNAMLKYLGHELTHAIENGSAQGYADYRTAVKEALRKRGQSYEALVRGKLETAAAQGVKLTLGGAEAEVIADASEFMLENTAYISNAPKSVMARVQKVISDFAKKVRQVFATLTGGHRESQALRELKDNMYRYVDNLQNLWDIAATEMADGERIVEKSKQILHDEAQNGQKTEQNAQEAEQSVPVDELESTKQFSMRSSVEKRDDGLLAVHNIKEGELYETLTELGGFPMPSVAIIKARQGHTDFGEYSVIFGSDTIDPQGNSKNKVYGNDAWTPTFPQVEYKINSESVFEQRAHAKKILSGVDGHLAEQAGRFYNMLVGMDTTGDDAKTIAAYGKANQGVLAEYLTERGEMIEIPTREVKQGMAYDVEKATLYDRILDKIGYDNLKGMTARTLLNDYGTWLSEQDDELAKLWDEYTTADADKKFSIRAAINNRVKAALAYEDAGRSLEQKNVIEKNYNAAAAAMYKKINKAEFDAWLKEKIGRMLSKKGLYNGKERYKANGDRVSFERTHESFTAENVVRLMQQVDEEGTGHADTAKGIVFEAAKQYESLDAIRADTDRLKSMDAEARSNLLAEADAELSEIYEQLGAKSWDEKEVVGSLLARAGRENMTAQEIAKLLQKNGYKKVTTALAQEARDLVTRLQNLPTEYFEAKPARVVGFDEIRMVVAPDNMSTDLATAMDERGIPYTTYETNDDTDRIEKMNAVEGVQFSMRDSDDGYDYSKSFAEQVDDWKKGNFPKGDSLLVGRTNEIYRKIGMGDLPMTINQTHVDYIVNGTKDSDHYMGEAWLKKLPEMLENPVAVIRSDTDAENSVVVILSQNIDGKQIIAPVYVNGTSTSNSLRIDSNNIASVFGKGNAVTKLLADALQKENAPGQGVGIYYWKKSEARSLLSGAGLQLPGSSVQDGLIHSIFDAGSDVNSKMFTSQTETRQFKRWFGNSEVTDDNGEPLVVYHTTRSSFTAFDPKRLGEATDGNASDGYLAATAHVGFWFNTQPLTGRGMGNNAMPVYLSAQHLYEAGTLDGLTSEIWGTYPDEYETEDPTIEQAAEAGEYFRSYLESYGYDGIVMYDTEFGGKSYVVFEPEQIKSATENIGTFGPQNPDIRYALRDDATAADVREVLSAMEVTDSMNATEKDMLTRYKAKLQAVQDWQKEIDQQKAIVESETATADEKAAAKARMRIYKEKQRRANSYLRTAEGSNGFARLMATSQELARRLTTQDVENAADSLGTEIGELTKKLDTVNQTLEQTRKTMKNAEVRAMFDPKKLGKAADTLKTGYGLKMSQQELRNRLAALYATYAGKAAKGRVGKAFVAELRNLAEDMYENQKAGQNYQSDLLETIGLDMGGTMQVSDSELEQLKVQGISYSEFKRALSPYIKVTRGGTGSQALATAQAAQYYAGGGTLAAMMEGVMNDVDALSILYETFVNEKSAMQEKNAPGMTRDQMIGSIMGDIMGELTMPDLGGETAKRLKAALKRSGANVEAAANVLSEAAEEARKSARDAGRMWSKIAEYEYEAKAAAEYYRALEEKRRLTELKEQKKTLTEQLKSEAAKKLAEQRERQMDLNAIRAQTEKNRATEKRIRTKVKRLDKLIRRETDQKHIPEGFKPVVEELMRLFINQNGLDVFGNPNTEAGKRAIDRAWATYELLGKVDGEDLHQMSDYYDYDVSQNLLELKQLLNKLGEETELAGTEKLRTKAAFMERTEEIVDMIAHTAENIGQIQIGEKRVALEQIAWRIKQELDKKETYSVSKGALGKVKGATKTLTYGNMTPAYFFRDMNLTPMTELSEELFRAENQYGKLFNEAQGKVAEMEQKYHYWDWIFDDTLTLTTQQGLSIKQPDRHKITIDKGMALQLYATWKRESQYDPLIQTNHLKEGGFEFATMQEVDGRLVADNTAHKISELDMRTIEDYLTEEQKNFADEFVKYLTELGGTLGNETSMELFGIKKFKDTYYFPIQVAKGQLYQQSNAGHGTTDDSRIKHMPFTNRRINQAVKPITIGSFVDVGTRHIQQMLTYHTFTVPLENMNKVLNQAYDDEDTGSRTTIREMIKQKYGQEAISYLEKFIADLNGGIRKDSTEKGFIRMLSSFKKGATAASLSVAIQQPTSIIRALAEVPARYFTPFTHGDTNTQYRKEWEQLKKHSGVAVIKDVGGIDMTRSGSMAEDLAGNLEDGYNAFKKAKLALGIGAPKGERGAAAMRQWDNMFGKLAETGDKVAWIAMWRAIKSETKDLNPSMDTTSDAFLDKAGERFNEVMRLTQVYDSTLARSQWMRSSSGLMKMVTSFGAEGTLTVNMLYDGFKNGDAKAKTKAAGIFFASQIITAAAAAIIKAGRDDDKDKTYAEKYLSAMGSALGGWGGAFNPLSALPGVRDIMNLLDGYDVERSDMSIVSDLIGEAEKLASGKYKDSPWKAVENAGGAIANAFGVPLKNIMRDARTLYNTALGLFDPPRASNQIVMSKDALDNFTMNVVFEPDTSVSAYYAKLYKAMEEGDTQEESDLREYLTIIGKDSQAIKTGLKNAAKAKYSEGKLTDEEAIQWLVENGYADDEDAAYWTVEEWKYKQENGTGSTYSKYADFYQAVETGENLKSTIKHYTDNGVTKSVLKGRVTDMYFDELLSLWMDGKKGEYANLLARMLTAYAALGYNRLEMQKEIEKKRDEKIKEKQKSTK